MNSTQTAHRSDTSAPAEPTADRYAQLVNDEKNKPFIETLLKLRDGLLYGEITLKFEGGKCVHQQRSASQRVTC